MLLCGAIVCGGRQLKALLGSCEVSGLPQASALVEGALHFCYWVSRQLKDFVFFTLHCGICNVSLPHDGSSETMSVVWLSAISHQILPFCQFSDEVNSGEECLSREWRCEKWGRM